MTACSCRPVIWKSQLYLKCKKQKKKTGDIKLKFTKFIFHLKPQCFSSSSYIQQLFRTDIFSFEVWRSASFFRAYLTCLCTTYMQLFTFFFSYLLLFWRILLFLKEIKLFRVLFQGSFKICISEVQSCI